jgi:flagellar basal-body rod modification protein FlgD
MASITKTASTTNTGMTVTDAIDGTVTKATNSSELGKDAFMQLLVAQIKNQDPLNPTDSSESIAQMAQFSSLEQMQNLNTTMTNIYNYQTTNTLVSNAALIGKTVTALDSEGNTVTGKINAVGLSDDGKTAVFSVVDSKNKTNVIEAANIIAVAQS